MKSLHSLLLTLLLSAAGPVCAWWQPLATDSLHWQYQLQGDIATPGDAGYSYHDVMFIDMDTPGWVVNEFKAAGTRVVCYISAGSAEVWRADYGDFPSHVIGADYEGWEGEKWLDIRDVSALQEVMGARLDKCRDKGFDAIEADNVNVHVNYTGFSQDRWNVIAYVRWLADQSHQRGMAYVLKNAEDIVPEVADNVDMLLSESCFAQGQCEQGAPIRDQNKPVLMVEYNNRISADEFSSSACRVAETLGYQAIYRNLDLDNNGIYLSCTERSVVPVVDQGISYSSNSCQRPVSGPYFPECVNASSDSVGDGWGWENAQSCVVTRNSINAESTRFKTACVNESGIAGAYGPNNCLVTDSTCAGVGSPSNAAVSACITPVTGAYYSECRNAASDSVGEGWGWEDNTTCVVTANSINAERSVVQSACNNESGIVGLFGPNNCVVTNRTCQGTEQVAVTGSTVSQPVVEAGQYSTPVNTCDIPVADHYKECSDANSDSVGFGWGWENGESCVVTINSDNAEHVNRFSVCENETGRSGRWGPDGCVITNQTCIGGGYR